MNLLHKDLQAKDPLFNKIQENYSHCEPPDLYKKSVEELYRVCDGLLDKKFSNEIKLDFASRYSELYFGAVFRKRLGFNIIHPSDSGPDFFIKDIDCWAEVVTARDGKIGNPNSILKSENGKISDYPKEKVILRLTNSFIKKAKIIKKYIDDGKINSNQKIIICISGGWLNGGWNPYPEGGYPQIVEALLPVGNMVYRVDIENNKITDKTFEYREFVNKLKSEGESEEIQTDFFLRKEFNYISAVVYSYANAANPININEIGSDFFFIHNPLANNPIPPNSIKCGKEYLVNANENSFTIEPAINHEKS